MAKPHKKILILGCLPPPVSGATHYYDTLLKTKVADEFDIIFLNLRFVDSISDLGRFSVVKVLLLVGYVVKLLWILITNRINLVYAAIAFGRFSFVKDVFLAAVCRLFGRRVVGCLLGTGLQGLYDQSGWLMKRFITWGVGLYCTFTTPSYKMYEKYFSKLLPMEKARTVPFGIFTDTSVTSRKLIKATDPVRIIYYSHFIRSKGIDEVLRAIPLVIEKYPKVSFLFIGSWDSEAHKKVALDIVDSTGIREWVKFRGLVAGDARKICLRESDIFLLPTYFEFEGLPLSILEAMSYGCAIIATDHGAISSAVEDGVNGIICRPRDPRNLALKINQLIEDSQLLLRMQQNSLRKFRELFTAERFGENLAKELLSLMEPEL